MPSLTVLGSCKKEYRSRNTTGPSGEWYGKAEIYGNGLPPALSSDATTLGALALHLEFTTKIAPDDQAWTLSVQRKEVACCGRERRYCCCNTNRAAPGTAASGTPGETKKNDDEDDGEAGTGAPSNNSPVQDETNAETNDDDAAAASSTTSSLSLRTMTEAELKAVYDKADITGNAPEFEEAVVDGETLYDLFMTQSFEAVVGDYFNSDELRPLGERLWADLTLINDASRARDARRIFAILDLLLADLRERQEKGDADGEQKEDATSGDVVHVHVDTLVRDAHYP